VNNILVSFTEVFCRGVEIFKSPKTQAFVCPVPIPFSTPLYNKLDGLGKVKWRALEVKRTPSTRFNIRVGISSCKCGGQYVFTSASTKISQSSAHVLKREMNQQITTQNEIDLGKTI
jgi:hypothetical protein